MTRRNKADTQWWLMNYQLMHEKWCFMISYLSDEFLKCCGQTVTSSVSNGYQNHRLTFMKLREWTKLGHFFFSVTGKRGVNLSSIETWLGMRNEFSLWVCTWRNSPNSGLHIQSPNIQTLLSHKKNDDYSIHNVLGL